MDLLWLHMWDATTPIEEVLRSFDDLVKAGKVLHVGLSDTPAWVVSQAVAIAGLRGWAAPVAAQAPYSMADRSLERDILPMAKSLGLAVTPWGLLEGGVLTGKYNAKSEEARRYGDDQQSERELNLARTLKALAEEVGRSPSQVAITWVRQQPWPFIPIIGARTEAQIVDNLRCLEFELTPEQVQKLSDASPIQLGFPRGFLESDGVRSLIFGDTFDLLDP